MHKETCPGRFIAALVVKTKTKQTKLNKQSVETSQPLKLDFKMEKS